MIQLYLLCVRTVSGSHVCIGQHGTTSSWMWYDIDQKICHYCSWNAIWNSFTSGKEPFTLSFSSIFNVPPCRL